MFCNAHWYPDTTFHIMLMICAVGVVALTVGKLPMPRLAAEPAYNTTLQSAHASPQPQPELICSKLSRTHICPAGWHQNSFPPCGACHCSPVIFQHKLPASYHVSKLSLILCLPFLSSCLSFLVNPASPHSSTLPLLPL